VTGQDIVFNGGKIIRMGPIKTVVVEIPAELVPEERPSDRHPCMCALCRSHNKPNQIPAVDPLEKQPQSL
jgi:hypothetical protein